MSRVIPITLGLGVLAPTLLAAQTPLTVAPGDTIRLRVDRRTPWEAGTVLAVRRDELLFRSDSVAVTVPISSIARLEVRRPHRFDGGRALIGAGLGFGLGALLTMTDDDAPAWGVAASGGVFALYGAAVGGGGRRAKRAGLIGYAIGAVPGAVLGAATSEPCAPDAWICFGREFWTVMGAMAGGAAGGLIGSWIGALTPGSVWEPVPATRLTLAPGAYPGLFFVSVVLSR